MAKMVLISPSVNPGHGDDTFVTDTLDHAVELVQHDMGGRPDEWYYFDIEVGEPIAFELKPLRKEVPVRKSK